MKTTTGKLWLVVHTTWASRGNEGYDLVEADLYATAAEAESRYRGWCSRRKNVYVHIINAGDVILTNQAWGEKTRDDMDRRRTNWTERVKEGCFDE